MTRRWIFFLPGTVLILAALIQLYLVFQHDLSPCSGGGFGMFSTADAGGNRHLHAYEIRPGIIREIEIPHSLRDKFRNIIMF